MKNKKVLLTLVIFVVLAAFALGSCSEGRVGYNDFSPVAPGGYNKSPLSGDEVIPSEPEDPAYFDSEAIGKIIENDYVKTDIESTSTFSADVDTAAYSYFRKLVNSGYNLTTLKSFAGNSLRTEEMVNYFKYSVNAPTGNDLFGVKTQIADCPWNVNAKLMVINLKAKEVTVEAGNNLVFLIDVSGSMMSSDKLPLLKESFAYLTAQLTENDTVSIVTYAGKEEVVLDGCKGSMSELIQSKINSLTANGSTYGEAGLRMAYQLAEKNFIPGGNNRIIMASDGDLNVGISSADALKSFVEEKRNSGVYLSVLGFGTGNYKDEKMETLADNGNGAYYYVDGTTEAEKIFGTDLTSNLITVAEDVKMQLTFDPQYVDSYRLVGYENRLLNNEDFENDLKDAGEVGSGHTVTVLYELMLKEEAFGETVNDWLKLAVRYKDPAGELSKLNEYSIGKSAYTETPDDDFKFICAVAETSMYMRSSKLIDDIDLEYIKNTLDSITITDPYKAEFKELIATLIIRN